MTPWIIPAAVAVDLALGDPEVRWHPVRLAGGWISGTEKILRRLGVDGYMGGVILLCSTLAVFGLPVFLILRMLSSWPALLAGTAVLYFSIALGSLIREAESIRRSIEAASLDDARRGVARICGRDTEHLDSGGMIRATVESLAENSVDGFTAPLFYAALLGPAGAWMYRVANTLDSMVGYKNEKYIRFGWASARFDDLLNFVPARLTAVLLALFSPLVRGNFLTGIQTMWRFAGLHPSPNAGWTESAVGGALGLRLGGPAFYFGRQVDKAYLGSADREPLPRDIQRTEHLIMLACVAFALITSLVLHARLSP